MIQNLPSTIKTFGEMPLEATATITQNGQEIRVRRIQPGNLNRNGNYNARKLEGRRGRTFVPNTQRVRDVDTSEAEEALDGDPKHENADVLYWQLRADLGSALGKLADAVHVQAQTAFENLNDYDDTVDDFLSMTGRI